MKRVAILGCGPAGLLAAHAAHLCRVEAHVYSKAEKSVISGAQFLHQAIPDLTAPRPDDEADIIKFGSAEGYATKVYGASTAPTSFDLLKEGAIPIWSMAKAYDTLWGLYGGENIMPASGVLKSNDVRDLAEDYDLVISTIPVPALCYSLEHVFPSAHVKFTDGLAPGLDTFQNFIMYSGDPKHLWYRTSSLFGHEQTEWPMQAFPSDSKDGFKPLRTNCNCCPEVVRVGRFGKWEKGVLVHHAFQEAVNALQQL